MVSATYRFTEDNWPLFEASHQQPIRWQPTLEGDSDNLYSQVISDDRDVLLGKLSTEVHVHGTLRSPTGLPRSTWQVRVQVGPVDKRLIVRGPREFRWQLLGGWRVTDPTPVSEVPLDYRYAFGGHYRLPDEDALTNTLYYPDNPAGRGWLPSRADYKRVSSEVARYLKPDLNAVTRLPAPQLEDPDWLVTSPFDRPAPAGFGPIAPWWEPRVSYQGTFDDHWRNQRLPYWPEDFDYRFHHSAPADLVAPDYLRGDELMILTNCLPNSRAIMVEMASGQANTAKPCCLCYLMPRPSGALSVPWLTRCLVVSKSPRGLTEIRLVALTTLRLTSESLLRTTTGCGWRKMEQLTAHPTKNIKPNLDDRCLNLVSAIQN